MATRKLNIGKLDTEIATLVSQRSALTAFEDAAIINDFMIAICEDPSKVEAYKKNPEAYVREAGLPAHLTELVLSGSRYAFRAAASGELEGGKEGETVVVVVIIVIVVIL